MEGLGPIELLNPKNYLRDKEEYHRRVALCNSCPKQKFSKILLGRQCEECGCLTDLKAKLKTQSCPDGKW